MNDDPALDTRRDAIQTYVRTVQHDHLVLTDFVIGYAAIDMHTAGDEVFIGTTAHGAPHATLGLAHILPNELLEGDDE